MAFPYDNLNRNVLQGDMHDALHRVSFCLDQIEKIVENDIPYHELFGRNFYDQSRLTMEEVVGALVISEQIIKDYISDDAIEE